jgi:prepilin-type N-terminal cleavage/methylation domain-containing protein
MTKKQGFTLAEVLMTLAILGTVAALSLPSVTSNVMESQLKTAFQTSHHTISDKLDAAMALEDVQDIRELKAFQQADINGFFSELGNYLNFTAVDGDHTVYAFDKGSNSVATWPTSNTKQIHTKAFMYVEDFTEAKSAGGAAIRAAGGALLRRNAIVWLDVNGYTKPNRLGYDVFKFYLGQDGRLYPVGGRDVSLYESAGGSDTSMSWEGGSEDFKCDKSVKGFGCAGRLAATNSMKYLKEKSSPAG